MVYLPLLPLWVTQLGASTHLLTASLHNFTHHLKKWTINRIPSPAKSPFFSHFFSPYNTTSSPLLPSTNQELPRIRAADSDWLFVALLVALCGGGSVGASTLVLLFS